MKSLTFLCISCEFKGGDFMRAIHSLGHKCFFITAEKTRNEDWPYECIEESFYMPESDGRLWNLNDLVSGTAHLFKNHQIDKIIALDDYDVSKAAYLREEFRSPGMGHTTSRHFYDKLAMRIKAKEEGIRIPGFSSLFNDAEIAEFLQNSEGPWVVKPRMDGGALGIRKIKTIEDFWKWNHENKNQRHLFLIEEFKPGSVFHVDTLLDNYETIFTRCSKYVKTPFEIAHGGGVFASCTLPSDDKAHEILEEMNDKVLWAFGLNFGASHSEFIHCEADGEYYFLETSARVGGANLADMVEKASGVNLWKEWATIEVNKLLDQEIHVPKDKGDNAGIIVTLSRVAHPDYSLFKDDSIVWTLNKSYHIGLIVAAKAHADVMERINHYSQLFQEEYSVTIPLKE